jgi:hypothetical protein
MRREPVAHMFLPNLVGARVCTYVYEACLCYRITSFLFAGPSTFSKHLGFEKDFITHKHMSCCEDIGYYDTW